VSHRKIKYKFRDDVAAKLLAWVLLLVASQQYRDAYFEVMEMGYTARDGYETVAERKRRHGHPTY
jgi:hypothetical protein